MKKNKCLALLLCVLMAVSLLPAASGRASAVTDTTEMREFEGTIYSDIKTYKICAAQHLKDLATLVNEWPMTMEGYTFYLANDIDLNPGFSFIYDAAYERTAVYNASGVLLCALGNDGTIYENLTSNTVTNLPSGIQTWTPIGTETTAFCGTFDGNSHTVKGIYCNSDSNMVGLFLNSSGTIRNVGVVNNYIHGAMGAGIVAYNEAGSISNCYNEGTITCLYGAGGICASHNGDCTIDGCSNSGTVLGTDSFSPAGGITALIENGSGGIGSVINCSNTGNVTGGMMAGGITGGADSLVDMPDIYIENCYNSGSIGGALYSGGIIGCLLYDQIHINNCYNCGSVSYAASGAYGSAGGIAGKYLKGSISHCYYLKTVNSDTGLGDASDMSAATEIYPFTAEQGRGEETAIKIDGTYAGLGDALNAWVDAQNALSPGKYNVWYTYPTANDGYPQFYQEIAATASGYIGAYDGNTHGITVKLTTAVENAVIYYGRTPLTAENYLTDGGTKPIYYRDITNSIVYYYIVANGYLPASGKATVTITSGSPLIAAYPSATAPYGTALADIPLTDGATTVEGSWSWVEPDAASIIPEIDGTTAYAALFTPADPNYDSVRMGIVPTIYSTGHTVYTAVGVGGTVFPQTAVVEEGGSLTVTVVPAAGYEVADVSVNGVSVGAVTSYTIRNIREDQTVFATFRKASGISVIPGMTFADVLPGAWYYDGVQYVYNARLMNGTSMGLFEPDGTMTRAMLATVLWRMEGRPHSYTLPFSDVASGQWYTEPVSWAYESGVINGVGGGRFAPDGLLTREQVVSMLYRYLAVKGRDVGASAELKGFGDADEVSPYAARAMRWAVAEGILPNTESGALNPKAFATRAEVAEMLRLISLYL